MIKSSFSFTHKSVLLNESINFLSNKKKTIFPQYSDILLFSIQYDNCTCNNPYVNGWSGSTGSGGQ